MPTESAQLVSASETLLSDDVQLVGTPVAASFSLPRSMSNQPLANVMGGSASKNVMGGGASLESLIEAIDNKAAQIALVRARAASTGAHFAELMMHLCAGPHAEVQDDTLLATVATWPAVTMVNDGGRHKQLIDDLVALQAAMEGDVHEVASQIVTGYARSLTMPLPTLLMELHQAGGITIDDQKLCDAVQLKANTVRWEDSKWEAASEPTFVRLRDARGRRLRMVFLGDVVNNTDESTPQQVLLNVWGLAKPSTAITLDAGTIHPRHCDEVQDDAESKKGLSLLPKFKQFLAEAGEEEWQRQTRAQLRQSAGQAETGGDAYGDAALQARLSRPDRPELPPDDSPKLPARKATIAPASDDQVVPFGAGAVEPVTVTERLAAVSKIQAIQRGHKLRMAGNKVMKATRVVRRVKSISEEKRFRINGARRRGRRGRAAVARACAHADRACRHVCRQI